MAYIAPKTDWTSVDGVLSTDLNRIEGNIETLATLRAYPTATGTGTAIVVTTGYFELTAGRSFTFIASANNSGAATTINADGTGAKNLYKPNTTDAPTIISGKAYTVWYNGTSFFVKASAEGDAVAGDVIKDKTFSNDEDTGITGTLELTGNAAVGDVLATKTFYNTDPKTKRTGTMTNNGTVSTDISAKATEVTIAQGYHSGSGKVKISATEQAKIITGNIKAGITVLGVAGKSSVVDTADADATAGDIANSKVAYVNGSKITGNHNVIILQQFSNIKRSDIRELTITGVTLSSKMTIVIRRTSEEYTDSCSISMLYAKRTAGVLQTAGYVNNGGHFIKNKVSIVYSGTSITITIADTYTFFDPTYDGYNVEVLNME